mgnify:CR=1 FL=1
MTQFKKGQSGNKAGRPVGSGISGKIRKAIADKAPEIIDVLITQALAGDTQSGLALINKITPNLKAANEPVQFNIDTSKGLTGTGEQILQSIADGTVALDSGTQILSSLAALAKMKEIDELTKRIESLERRS